MFRAFPVVRAGRLIGMVDRKILTAALDAGRAASSVGDLYGDERPEVALPDETCRHVAARLAARSLDRVPVVADESSYRLIGIVSRHDLVKPSLSVFSEEREREQFRSVSLARGKGSIPGGDRAPRR